MNLLQALNFFEKKLRVLSKTQYMQLYLIPIFIAIFIIYNFVDLKHEREPKIVEKLEKNELDSYLFLKQLQEFSHQQGVEMSNLKQNGLKFALQIEGEFVKLMQLILFCESFLSVNDIMDFKFSSNPNHQTLWLEFELVSYKYEAKEEYDKLLSLIPTLQNPFKTEMLFSQEVPKINLNAIVNNEVLLNDVWLKQGSTFLDYTLLEIHRRFIVLQKNNGEQLMVDLIRK